MSDNDIRYVRKAGEYFEFDSNYDKEISLEKLTQILYSKINPVVVTTNKNKLFKDYYDEINPEDLEFQKVVHDINNFFEITKAYDLCEHSGTMQKYFYIDNRLYFSCFILYFNCSLNNNCK